MADNLFNMSLVLPLDCPDKLKKIFIDSSNLNETLDNLLKYLGDVTNESHLVNVILEFIQTICLDSAIHSSEIEFAILSFQNIYNANLFKIDVKCKLLEMIVTVLLTYQSSGEVTKDVVKFLLNILEKKCEPVATCLTSMDCLTEIELNMPGSLKSHIDTFVAMLNHNQLNNKSSEITSLIIRNTTNDIPNQFKIVHSLLKMLPSLCPFTMVSVTRNVLGLCGVNFQMELENSLEKLIERHQTTYDLCILHTITSIQERLNRIFKENAIFVCCTHPALAVGRNLIGLDWLAASSALLKNEAIEIKKFQPTEFDGADARLNKLYVLSQVIFHQSLDPTPLCLHFEQLISFAVKSGTCRSFAAVFRTMRNMLDRKFPTNAIPIVLLNTVGLGARHPVCLPHIVDFLRNVGSNQLEQLSEAITLGLTDSFDEMEHILFIMPHLGHVIQFFTESTLYQYEFCQPRMVLRIIRNCLEANKSCGCGIEVLELCQALIRNQDYEIFQPELKTILSLIETSNAESDVKQRAWMLRSLITHVNTDSLKDAFDADMDLSLTGKIEKTEYSPILIKVLLDNKIMDKISESLPVSWSLERKRSCQSFYFPLEICLVENQKKNYREFFGLKIDFILDPKWGRAESIYIPALEIKQVRKACLQIHPIACSDITIETRVVMSTTDGRIFLSKLDPIHLKLEHFLSPLSSTLTFFELWDRLTNQSDKRYSSALLLPQSKQLFNAIEYGELEKFQMTKTKPRELAMVTPDSFLILVQILLVKNSWNAQIIVEDPSVLPVIHSLLIKYST